MRIAIVIPARYGSTRFPGKPLAKIGGRSMLSRVVDVAREAGSADIIVTTEDQRIADHAKEIGVECILTSADCATGSDRVLAAMKRNYTAMEYKSIVRKLRALPLARSTRTFTPLSDAANASRRLRASA